MRVVERSVTGVTDAELADLHRLFERDIFPVLTPFAVDAGRPFPFVPSLDLNLAVFVKEPAGRDLRFALVHLPGGLPRLIPIGGRGNNILLEDAVALFLPRLFPQMTVHETVVFRVTRVADWASASGSPRLRHTRVARLEVSEPISAQLLGRLMTGLKMSARHHHQSLR